MAKTISGHSAPKIVIAMAVMAMPTTTACTVPRVQRTLFNRFQSAIISVDVLMSNHAIVIILVAQRTICHIFMCYFVVLFGHPLAAANID